MADLAARLNSVFVARSSKVVLLTDDLINSEGGTVREQDGPIV